MHRDSRGYYLVGIHLVFKPSFQSMAAGPETMSSRSPTSWSCWRSCSIIRSEAWQPWAVNVRERQEKHTSYGRMSRLRYIEILALAVLFSGVNESHAFGIFWDEGDGSWRERLRASRKPYRTVDRGRLLLALRNSHRVDMSGLFGPHLFMTTADRHF